MTPTPRQSPIDIRTNDLCHDPKECKADCLNIDCKPGDCTDLICTSTGFRVNPGRNCKSTFSSPYLKDVYEFAQFHAHWGQDASCGSEHTIDGKKYAAEVHFVFYNTKYGSFAEAAEKDDGLAVVGVLLEKGNHNPNYEVLIDTVKKGIGNDKPVPMPKGYSWEGLLPPSNKRDFVTYLGSLTTPPYLESVIWTVFLTPVNISDQQLSILRKITPANYRSCQDVCGRTVRCSKAGSNSSVYL